MLLDYVHDYGERSFEQVKPNALDLLVLAEMSNFEYQPAQPTPSAQPASATPVTSATPAPLPLSQAIDAAVLPTITDARQRTLVSLENKEDIELAQLVKHAQRYAPVQFRDFRASYIEGAQQFGALAVTYHNVLCVAFRATDLTVTGWHESLELSLVTPTGSQVDAAEFLARNVADWDGPIIVCGHSKGGNLAEYSCRALAEQQPGIEQRILCICSFDGPGLAPELRDTDAYRRIAPLIHTFIPKSSIVGNIHDHPRGSVAYIDSDKPFVMQHYVYNWKTRGTHLIRSRQTFTGRVASELLNLLIAVTDDTAKRHIFNVLFSPYRMFNQRLL
ncbi:Mbeg1-like protein [Bifidobacterium gallicum]|uniref:DUF2974 domain-containing protein n=1 Tax=Bifidobacterium gallicum DSM 20093 = LMG 11596 TaxID=561180 RepID=D1NWH7_9BIFI|nr:Mbeg1-like protein [Bifidobacterium gallicum]EFA22463.1 hypothetical protein BIFGAL_04227 [Bifidobacterium gallicum DSM 20093 = LMG 11596]KFI60142.1 hypothetical protein BGLCM_0163 [Bifidobacterium gallicum DSM 20093 = LMG 11596]